MKKDRIRLISNVVLAVFFFTVWIMSFFLWRGEGALAGDGWKDLRYFTVESNLFVGITALLWVIVRLVKGREKLPRWIAYLKYLSTVSVFVTFAVVLLFLGPISDYGMMYHGSNFFFHLLIPLFAISEWVLFDEGEISFRESFFAMIPSVLYGVGYFSNIVVNGIGEGAARNDWYYFLYWGYPIGIVISVVICVLGWGAGLALRAMNRAAKRIPWEGRV